MFKCYCQEKEKANSVTVKYTEDHYVRSIKIQGNFNITPLLNSLIGKK
jgi:hypothetical protein